MSTLEAIAREVGVSRKTVSNVLNGKNKENWGSTALRAAKIREVAERVGYQPNVMARAIATGKSRVIGLVGHGMAGGSHNAAIQSGILEELTIHDYTAKALHVPCLPNIEHFSYVAQQCAMWKVEGAIVVSFDESDMPILKQQLDQVGCLVGFVGGIPPRDSLGVYSDINTSNSMAIEHLVDLGHRRIAFLGGAHDGLLALRQVESIRSVMRKLGLPLKESYIAYTDWLDADIIAAETHRLLNQDEPPTAIFCNSTIQAMVVLSTARGRGLKLPGQLSVLCYGEDQTIDYIDPPLTSLVQPSKEMGHLAVRQLLTRIEDENPDLPLRPLCVKRGIELVVRKSTAPPQTP